MEVTLAAGDMEAVFVPDVGMVGRSLRHRGEELLGQRGGLGAYAERGSSFGIPLLHPWANRLDARLDAERSPVRLDPNGLPIHGLLTAARGWEVTEQGDTRLSASFGFSGERLLAAFPHPHRLTVDVALDPAGLEVATTVRPTGDGPVPIAFGWHPYLALPGAPRGEWQVDMPVRERALLDERGIPTGEVEAVEPQSGALGDRLFDDLYLDLPQPATFAVSGGGRRVEVVFAEGYPHAQVYAPAEGDFICFEPMTAPTNALVSKRGLRHAAPGEWFSARFRLLVGTA